MRITLSQACAVLVCVLTASAWAQSYPSRPITFIVPFSLGTGIDLVARGLGARLAERWNIGVVIDNRTGASGNIGTEAVVKASPDGHTLLMTTAAFVASAAVNQDRRICNMGCITRPRFGPAQRNRRARGPRRRQRPSPRDCARIYF